MFEMTALKSNKNKKCIFSGETNKVEDGRNKLDE